MSMWSRIKGLDWDLVGLTVALVFVLGILLLAFGRLWTLSQAATISDPAAITKGLALADGSALSNGSIDYFSAK